MKKVYRVPLDYEKFTNQYDTAYWLERYTTIRNWEKRELFPPPRLKRIIQNSQDIEKNVDKMSAMRYINNIFRRSVATAEGSLNERQYAHKYADQKTLPFVSLRDFLDQLYRSQIGNF